MAEQDAAPGPVVDRLIVASRSPVAPGQLAAKTDPPASSTSKKPTRNTRTAEDAFQPARPDRSPGVRRRGPGAGGRGPVRRRGAVPGRRAACFRRSPTRPPCCALLTGDDSLISMNGLRQRPAGRVHARSSSATPASSGSSTDLPPKADVRTFDFTVARACPACGPGRLVIASVEGYQNPLSPVPDPERHAFVLARRPDTSARGRAVAFQPARQATGNCSDLARRASAPPSIVDRINGQDQGQPGRPSPPSTSARSRPPSRTSAGHRRSTARQPAARWSLPAWTSTFPTGESVLLEQADRRPVRLAQGRSVGAGLPGYAGPAQPGPRLARRRGASTGFLWSNEPNHGPAARPRTATGGCACPPSSQATPTAARQRGVNDLTAADGRRVIEAVGLQISRRQGRVLDCRDRGRTRGPPTSS